MDKATTKVRIVFDCATKCNGISLNDMIHAGPKLLQCLFNVLVRFRRNPVGIACDIKEMYLQIEVKSTYMDDSIDSVENDEEGVELYRQLKALWGAANMQARKWISNSPEVMETIPAEERATEIVIDSGQDPMTKTLGIS